jgi:hypothetical protein
MFDGALMPDFGKRKPRTEFQMPAQRAASQSRAGVEQNYQLELGANRQVYVSQVDAAAQIRNAGLEAAKLRQAAAVIAQVGREISREVGQGMRIRF